jgi:hypothetical protein
VTTQGSTINPRDYDPYARRFEAYCRQVGYGCTPQGYEQRLSVAEVEVLSRQYDAAALAARTEPDYLVVNHDGLRGYAEVKAHLPTRQNGAVEVVQLCENVKRSVERGIPVNYVFVPQAGAMRVRSAVAIVAVRRLVYYYPGNGCNDRARALLAELGLSWRWQESRPRGDAKAPDPYLLVYADELREWSVLQDSETIDAINETRRRRG